MSAKVLKIMNDQVFLRVPVAHMDLKSFLPSLFSVPFLYGSLSWNMVTDRRIYVQLWVVSSCIFFLLSQVAYNNFNENVFLWV